MRSERDALRGELADAQALTDSIAPRAVRGALRGTKVVLLVAPGADGDSSRSMSRMITAAGGSVTGTLWLTESFTDPDRAARLRELATRLLPAGARLPVTSAPGELAGGLMDPLTLLAPVPRNRRPDDRSATPPSSGCVRTASCGSRRISPPHGWPWCSPAAASHGTPQEYYRVSRRGWIEVVPERVCGGAARAEHPAECSEQ
ncbi:Copper transport outer membrane protein, MctB [Actinopolyspora lacussalsi subsp. righensis]|uniref:Copper transport outer membrane protein, MctB n=1 Tax=Actinopolyspora righensis TaxID=995060 RepID=A0A1I7C572_9ACTN|nr:Copper transport outer membrane protein, MctB [Actinopolyspora righensis]